MHKKTVKRIFINDSMPDAHLEFETLRSPKDVDGVIIWVWINVSELDATSPS